MKKIIALAIITLLVFSVISMGISAENNSYSIPFSSSNVTLDNSNASGIVFNPGTNSDTLDSKIISSVFNEGESFRVTINKDKFSQIPNDTYDVMLVLRTSGGRANFNISIDNYEINKDITDASVTLGSNYRNDERKLGQVLLNESNKNEPLTINFKALSTGSFYINSLKFVSTTLKSSFEMSTQYGASIRLGSRSGLRFKTEVDKNQVNSLRSVGAKVELGTLIFPLDLLTSESKTITSLTFDTKATQNGKEYRPVNVEYTGELHDDNTIWGSIVDLYEKNYTRKFVGRGYAKVTINGQTVISYASLTTSRSPAEVAYAIKSQGGNSEQELNILNKYTKNYNPENYSNMLEYVNNRDDVFAENLGIPYASVYSSQNFARNIWDMKSVDGKVLMGTGDYGPNTGPTPIYYYTNDSSAVHTDSKHLARNATDINSLYSENGRYGLSTESVERFFEFDGTVYALSTDPRSNQHASYYRYDSKNNVWYDYYRIMKGVHVYDMIEFDGKIFFGGMIRQVAGQEGNISTCIAYLPKDKLNTTTSPTEVYLYKDGTPVKDFKSGDYSVFNVWRVYDMFVYKGELYAMHAGTSLYSNQVLSHALFKYNKTADRFDMVLSSWASTGFMIGGDLAYKGKTILSTLRNTTFRNAKYTGTNVTYYAAHYDFDTGDIVEGPAKAGIESLYGIPQYGAKFSTDEKFVCVYNGIFESKDLKSFKKVSLGAGYENYVTRDAFEKDGKYYFLASVMNGKDDYTTAVFETDKNFNSFRKILSFKTKSFARSFYYNNGYLYVSLGGNGNYDSINVLVDYISPYCGTVMRVDLNCYMN